MAATRARAKTAGTRGQSGAATKGRRSDPRMRHTDGAAPWAQLKNRDPSRHYVLVYEGDVDHGPDYYRSIGYDVEEHSKSGVSLRAGRTGEQGQPIEMRGHVLMSCSGECRAEIERYGPDGVSGQEYADALEERMLDRRGGVDHLRGVGVPRGVSVENMTSAAQEEL